MAELGRVRIGDATIEYEVQRSERRRKTVQITLDGGRVLVAAPSDTLDSELEAIVRKRAPWILRQAPVPVPQASRKRFVSGETLPYLGRNVRVIVSSTDAHAIEVRFDHWSFRIAVPIGLDESKRYDEIRKAVVQWYRQRASRRLPRSLAGKPLAKFRATRDRRIPVLYGIVSDGIRHGNRHTIEIRRPKIDDLENVGFPARFLVLQRRFARKGP